MSISWHANCSVVIIGSHERKLGLHYIIMSAPYACQHLIQHNTCGIDKIVALQHA